MSLQSIDGTIFKVEDLHSSPIKKGEYVSCEFRNIDFSDLNLSEFRFDQCLFSDCNLSLVKLNNTSFRDTRFVNCKMLGLRLETCNKFGLSMSFESCVLNHSSFYQSKIKKAKFVHCQMHEVDFAESDLTDSLFENCDLLQSTFDRTVLTKADFRGSFNFSIHPENNSINKAKFSKSSITGLLYHLDIIIED